MTIVCGDSHTSTHGAFGALAFGIGTSEVEHVMATQCLQQSRAKTFRITVEGELPPAVGAKDVALGIIGRHRHRRLRLATSLSMQARRFVRFRWKAA